MTNWDAVVSRARALSDRFRADGSMAWYRGHRCGDWQLKSLAHRHVERVTEQAARKQDEADLVGLLREVSKSLYRGFKADAWSLLGEEERSDWAILFTMQHFGIPTRLLDWTESFACAVFFAQHRRVRGQTAAVWVVDPQALNKASVGKEGILSLDEDAAAGAVVDPRAWHPKWKADKPLPTIAVAPILTNPRMVAQRSAFTLAGDSFSPIEAQFSDLVHGERIVKLVLSPDTFEAAEEYLTTAGLTAFNYYPDLQGLAMKHEEEAERTIRDAKKFYPRFFT